ncbi:hypothetical protein BpHYR1_012785 [Brachionus plicatilis]|uniref:Uncharacterized protein n=1 Tax=Brachionus plicatilis TaxID=10195 RepID=A0A3M7RMB1_BRAPC|nr:hypothetical protein BpHYR1_012785 [Brachionus plicatilis]
MNLKTVGALMNKNTRNKLLPKQIRNYIKFPSCLNSMFFCLKFSKVMSLGLNFFDTKFFNKRCAFLDDMPKERGPKKNGPQSTKCNRKSIKLNCRFLILNKKIENYMNFFLNHNLDTLMSILNLSLNGVTTVGFWCFGKKIIN